MLNEENKDLCWKVLSKYGVPHQQHMVVEECSELIKAICKLFRYKDCVRGRHRINFLEELVDVIVMCQQMVLTEGLTDEMLNTMARIKLERALNEND